MTKVCGKLGDKYVANMFFKVQPPLPALEVCWSSRVGTLLEARFFCIFGAKRREFFGPSLLDPPPPGVLKENLKRGWHLFLENCRHLSLLVLVPN